MGAVKDSEHLCAYLGLYAAGFFFFNKENTFETGEC